jgi:phosphopantothenoylcysteine decarboxylase
MRNILLGVTGSVAAVKTEELYKSLSRIGEVKVVATKSAKFFLKRTKIPVITDEAEWQDDYVVGDAIEHIELKKWANCLVLAPLDANTLAKAAHGICDNLLTCIIRAWNWNKPLVICPAMNTDMWHNEPTGEQIKILKNRGAFVVPPKEGHLACGDVGIGAMANIEDIVSTVKDKFSWAFPLPWCKGIPLNQHPGAFAVPRKGYWHTGIDLYTDDGVEVRAVEAGTVVHIGQFTGPELGHTKWHKTWGVMVEGASGVVNYGEIEPYSTISVGTRLGRSSPIGRVKRVLIEEARPEIAAHSSSMLHLELYRGGAREFKDWPLDTKNEWFLDPTEYLMDSADIPYDLLVD